MSSKPTFVFVPGAWHGPECFDLIRAYLSERGFPSAAVRTPTVNSEPPLDSPKPDVDAIVSVLTPLLDAGRDVVLVMHSYAGFIGTEASGQIVEEERAGTTGPGGRGRLLRLVYVSAWVPLEDDTFVMPSEVIKDFTPAYFDVSGGNIVLNEKAKEWFYGDDGVPADEQQRLYEALGTHPLGAFTSHLSRAGWRSVPSTFVHALRDKAAPPAFARWMVERAREQGAFSDELGEAEMDCEHCTMFLVPDKVRELGGILLRTVGASPGS